MNRFYKKMLLPVTLLCFAVGCSSKPATTENTATSTNTEISSTTDNSTETDSSAQAEFPENKPGFTAEEALVNALEAYKALEFLTFNTYMYDVPNTVNLAISTKSDASIAAHANIDYNIDSIHVTGDAIASVTLSVTTMTLEAVLATFMSQSVFFEEVDEFGNEIPKTPEEEEAETIELNNLFDTLVSAEDSPKVTITFPVRMDKSPEGLWYIGNSESWMTALTNISIGLVPEVRETMVRHYEVAATDIEEDEILEDEILEDEILED